MIILKNDQALVIVLNRQQINDNEVKNLYFKVSIQKSVKFVARSITHLMSFFAGFYKGFINCFKGFNLIFEKGLWPWLFYPVILWFLMWMGSIWLFSNIAQYVADYFSALLDFKNIPDSGSWLSFAKPLLTGYFSIILTWVLKILFWFISGTFTKYMVLIFLSPLFSLLSESVDTKTTGKTYPFNFNQLLKDIARGILISLRNMLFEYLIIIICFILTLCFAPLIVITAPLLLCISWYFIGFTMLDYNFERHKMSISQSVQFVRKNKGLACGIGLVYSLFMILPLFLGIMFAPLLAVVGATISFLEINQNKELPIN
ncbi:MAG: EI24 domain-containing protein [Bacteroidota bacterium]